MSALIRHDPEKCRTLEEACQKVIAAFADLPERAWVESVSIGRYAEGDRSYYWLITLAERGVVGNHRDAERAAQPDRHGESTRKRQNAEKVGGAVLLAIRAPIGKADEGE